MPVVLSPGSAIRTALLLGLVAGGVAVAPPARGGGDAEKGRLVAERWCARCHVIGHAKRYAGIDSSPSFFLGREPLALVLKPSRTAGRSTSRRRPPASST